MISGKKLKRIRSFRKLTQKELAIMSGLTDAAIRNYELGNRSPNIEQLRKIADALNCDISALIDREPNSIFEIMHIIFDYEKEMKFRPLSGNGEPTALLSHNPHFDDFLIESSVLPSSTTIISKFLYKLFKMLSIHFSIYFSELYIGIIILIISILNII